MCNDAPKESEDNFADDGTPEDTPEASSADVVAAIEKLGVTIVGAIQTEGGNNTSAVIAAVKEGSAAVLDNQNNTSKDALDAASATKKTADKTVLDAEVKTAEAEQGKKAAEDKIKRAKDEAKIREDTFGMELNRLKGDLADSKTQNDKLTTKVGEITEAGRVAVVIAKDQTIGVLEDRCKAGEKRETTLKDEVTTARAETTAAKDLTIEILEGQLTEGQLLVGDVARNAHDVQRPELEWPRIAKMGLWFVAVIILLAFLLSFVTGVVSTTQASWTNDSIAPGTSEIANAVPTETPSTVSSPSSNMKGSTLPLCITGEMMVDSIDINAGADERLKAMQKNQ